MDSNTRIVSGVRFGVILVGLIGNIMIFKVFSTESLQKHPISVFFKVMSIFDMIMMLNGINFFVQQKFNYNLYNLKEDGENYLFYFFIAIFFPPCLAFTSVFLYLIISIVHTKYVHIYIDYIVCEYFFSACAFAYRVIYIIIQRKKFN